MGSSGKIPDAWDDDYVTRADDSSIAPLDPLPSSTKLTKAERRAKQAELNRQLWEDAETPKNSYFLNTREDVPLKSDFKPAMKVLSRKPASKTASTATIQGLDQLTLDDDDDDDDEESDMQKNTLTLEERQQKAQREREEKQRKYEEARERLFGGGKSSENPSTKGAASSTVKQGGESRSQSRNKGARDSRPSSSGGNKNRQLYDPNYTAKPGSLSIQKKENQSESGRSTPTEQQPIRSPRGPDKSGRGGFGFAPRGARGA